MCTSEQAKALAKHFPEGFDAVNAGEVFAQHLLGASADQLIELSLVDRTRIFNLGHYTWVEQQGVSIGDFTARRDQGFWRGLQQLLPASDEMIAEFNREAGTAS